MGKELIIASNRHETKVAALEDDQLVEIFYQRANEYSLAGSIHKGRVTRVLPGMQSAFVNIGLERDAFLYVSDFFEDNEEYDRLAAAAEDKVLKAERERHGGPAHAAPAPAPVIQAPPPAPVPAEEPAAAPEAVAAPVTADAPAEGEREQRGRDRDDDRRGRRSRRRRTRGRGFPDSKYADIRRESPPEAAPESVPESEPGADFMVLPGESLAKYGPRGESDQADEPEIDAGAGVDEAGADEPAEAAGQVYDAEPENAEEAPAEGTPEAIAEAFADAADEADAAAPEAEAAVAVEAPEPAEVAEEEPEDAPEPALALAEDEPVEGAEPVGPGGLVTILPDQAIPDAEEVAEETAVDAAAEEEPAAEEAEAEEAPAAEAGSEAIEPARMPVSLTATLRERGDRYMHRTSRRMRRKMRNQGQTPEGAAPAEVRAEAKPEIEVVSEPRANGKPRQERERDRDRDRGERDRDRGERERDRDRDREKPSQPSISELLREGQEILVQIAKEPLGQKGARITSHIALPGRYVVYMPTVEHLGVSRKISTDEERLRLKRLLQTHRAGIPGGFIVRTAGEGRTEQEIAGDMRFLFNLWLDIRAKAESRPAPLLVHHDLDVVSRILRDQMAETFKSIWVDNEELYEQVVRFVERFQPQAVNRVKLYTRETPIFDAFNITAELERALRPKVWLKSGGYIVINQTEALVAIDVNTGKFVGKSNRLEDTIVKTNTEAVKEIVRQIRLRDLGGIIVVDFIDMDERKNRQKVMQALEEAMRADRAPNKILQFNDFGLVAITRKRVKQSLERTLCSPCPYCEGAGYVKSVQTVIGEILQEAQKLARVIDTPDATLRVHPEVAKVLKSTSNHSLEELEETLRRPVIVKSDPLLNQEKFDLV